MPTSDLIINRIKEAIGDDALITRDQLIEVFRNISPDITDTAIRNRIHNYTRKGILAQLTNMHFTHLVKDNWKPTPEPNINSIWKILIEDYSNNNLCFWTTKWFNEFINLQAFNEVIFIEAEEIIAESVYHRLSEELTNIFFAPNEKEIDYYIAGKQKSYIVRPLITRAPIYSPIQFTVDGRKKKKFERRIPLPRIEKLLTDIYYDNKTLSAWKYEEEKIWQDGYDRYNINFSTIYNYAKRRDNSAKIIDFIISTLNNLPDDIAKFLKENEILESTKSFKKADPSIVELVIYAFYLLEHLSIQDLDFVFKGGTCLMLHFDPPLRFSTDIDITTQAKRKEIEAILDKIINDSEFIRWELDEKRSYKPGIPKAHYKLFFNSEIAVKEREILFDILFQESLYPKMESVEIRLPFIASDNEKVTISIPTTDELLGDKLTAFAPGTIGIQFNSNKGRDIVKQIFDIGCLQAKHSDIKLTTETFKAITQKELAYRELDNTLIDIAEDVFNTAVLIGKVFRNQVKDNEKGKELEIRTALRSFIPFTISSKAYTVEALLLDASIAAYLTALIATENTEDYSPFDTNTQDLMSFYFTDPNYSFLNRLSRLPNGSLYYLKSTYDMLYG